MKKLTIEKLIEMGGKEWNKGEMNRVYISQDIFNEITGFGYSLNDKKWKFYADVTTGDVFRASGKKPVREGNISEF